MTMTPDQITALFTRPDGSFAFSRWTRPIAPVVFGVEDATLPVLKGAVEAIARLAGVEVAETDPELGANLMMFFIRDWGELAETPNMDRLVPDLRPLVDRLKASEATQYRFFRFDAEGGIKAAFLFVRMDATLSEMPAETLALGQAVQAILLWAEGAFAESSPLALHPEKGVTILRPEVADVIRAAYDPILPASAGDASHALRIAARAGATA